MARDRPPPPLTDEQRELRERAHEPLDRLRYRVSDVVAFAESGTEDGRRALVVRTPAGSTMRRNGDPVWTDGCAGESCLCCLDAEGRRVGHREVPCLACGLPTGVRSPGGFPFCHDDCRAARHALVDRSNRKLANAARVPGVTVGGAHVASVAKMLRERRASVAPRANPDPVGAAREREAFADHEGLDGWEDGRE